MNAVRWSCSISPSPLKTETYRVGTQIVEKRGDANRLGFALQARAGRWLEDAERTYAAILMVEPDSAEPVASCPVSWSSAM